MGIQDGGDPVAILLSVLAFILGFFAVWFAASANSVAERTSRDLMTTQIKIFRNAMAEQNKATAELAKRLLTLEKAFHGLKNARSQDAENFIRPGTEFLGFEEPRRREPKSERGLSGGHVRRPDRQVV